MRTACVCQDLEPYDGTYDLERRIQPPLHDPRYGTFERVDELLIQCRACKRRWNGEPLLGGAVYGDTRWWWDDRPEP